VTTTTGFANARVAIATNIFMYSRATAGATIPIGEFSAEAGSFVSAGGGSSAGIQNAVTWRVGGLNSHATNAAIFQGTTALIKEGSGNWTLTGASTHGGTTLVNNGTLTVNGSLNGSPLTIAGGKLSGSGVIAGAPVTINSAGTLAPGSPFGTLTISNNLTLAAGSTTLIQVQHAPLTSDTLKVTGTFTANGTLSVSDTGSGTLTNGDTFTVFNAPNYSGNFTNIILPALGSGLLWDTNSLKSNGTLTVVAIAPPVFSSVVPLGNGTLRLNFSGTPGAGYEIRASTDVMLSPVTLWTLLGTGTFTAAPVIFDDVQATNFTQRYYRIRVP
jgi:autotransporter-associated beta strand protein